MGGGSLYHDPPPPSTLTGVTESPGPPTATPRIVCSACRMRFATLVDPACRLSPGTVAAWPELFFAACKRPSLFTRTQAQALIVAGHGLVSA